MFVSSRLRLASRFVLVALATFAIAIVFSSSPAAAQGKVATSRVGYWRMSVSGSGFTSSHSIYNIHLYSGAVEITNDPVNGDAGSYDSYGAAYSIYDPGYDDGMSYTGDTEAVLTNKNSYAVELHPDDAYLYVYAFGGVDSLGTGDANSRTSIVTAFASGSASQPQITNYGTSYLNDAYYGFPITLSFMPNQSFTAIGSCGGSTSM